MAGDENPLSKREQEILILVARGLTNQEIAHDLVISPNTVKVHLRNIYAKLEASSRTDATVKAAQAGWIQVAGLEEEQKDEEAEPASLPPAPPLPAWQRVYFFAAAFLVLAALLLPGFLGTLRAATPASELSDQGLPRLGAPPMAAVPRWNSLAPLPQARSRLALVESDGLLLAVGGEGADGVSAALYVYDPQTNGWLPRADKPTAAANVQAAVLDGLIYVPGGTTADGLPSSQLEVYDPAADAWSSRAALPEPLAGYALAATGGRLFLFGGWDGQSYVDRALVYDPQADHWDSLAALPRPLGFAAAAALGDRVYLVGGANGALEFADCNVYEPSADFWSSCAALIQPRSGFGLAADGTSLYAVGGGWQEPMTFNERYDSLNNTWSSAPSPIQGQWRHLGAASLGPAIYAVGGWSDDYLDVNAAFQGTFRAFLPLGARGQ